MKIYTKTGDKGKTALIGGTKVSKGSLRIEAYGNVDELNSFVGFVMDQTSDAICKADLKEIQDRLFTIGAELACDPEKQLKMKIPDIYESDIEFLEKRMDEMEKELPPLKNFILPGGHPSVSSTHIARCVCRRAERSCVQLQDNESYVDPIIIKYLNRLSDYLFMLSRYTTHLLGVTEIPWIARK
ncbi:MAG: cob(I)yrinic acid a,c-diamide adenosyltransferase [Bacteroidetes bacterium]|nr:cob(I)yrinic acid a,c-diamide adenosyltransferase [Bacteroidota bacterium]